MLSLLKVHPENILKLQRKDLFIVELAVRPQATEEGAGIICRLWVSGLQVTRLRLV